MPNQIQAVERRRNQRSVPGEPLRPALPEFVALFFISRQQDDSRLRRAQGPFHEPREQPFRFGVVIVRFGGRRTDGDEEIRFGEPEIGTQSRIGLEFPGVNVLLGAGIFQDALGLAKNRFRGNHLGHHLPRRMIERE